MKPHINKKWKKERNKLLCEHETKYMGGRESSDTKGENLEEYPHAGTLAKTGFGQPSTNHIVPAEIDIKHGVFVLLKKK